MMTKRTRRTHYLLCVSNRGYRASLMPRRVYRGIPDATAARGGMVRVVDETGEDYLFPLKLFVEVELPPAATRAFRTAG
jgi:hypothetical protein